MLRLFSFPKECPSRGFSGDPAPQRPRYSCSVSYPLNGQLGRLDRNGNRAPGNIFIYQSNHLFFGDNLSRSVVIALAPPFDIDLYISFAYNLIKQIYRE